MSLLNDMLKDLDTTKSQSSLIDKAGTPSSSTFNAKRLVLPVVAGLAVLAWLVLEANLFGVVPEEPSSALPEGYELNADWSSRLKAQQASQAPVDNTQEVSTEAVDNAKSRGSQPQLRDASEVPQNSGSAKTLNLETPTTAVSSTQAMLDSAYQFLNEGRWVSPQGANAYETFSKVLDIVPNHPQALRGIDAVRAKLLSNLEQVLASGDREQLRRALADARKFGLSESALGAFSKALDKLDVESRGVGLQQVTEVPIAKVTKTDKQKDFDMAARLNQQGLLDNEEAALRLIKQNSEYERTVVALASSYFSLGESVGLQTLANVIVGRSERLAEFVRAYSAIFDGHYAVAIEAFSKVDKATSYYLTSQRMLAAVYQMDQQLEQSANLYRRLVQSRDATVDDWLGFAVTSDQLKLWQQALLAYERVVALRHPDKKVQQYAASRVLDLQR